MRKQRLYANNPTKAQQIVATMPNLKHNSEPFDITQSEVVQWLIRQPLILQALFNYYKDSGCIVFDREKSIWRGVSQ